MPNTWVDLIEKLFPAILTFTGLQPFRWVRFLISLAIAVFILVIGVPLGFLYWNSVKKGSLPLTANPPPIKGVTDSLRESQSAQISALKIAYYYPDPSGVDSAAQDGAVQRQGFQDALDDARDGKAFSLCSCRDCPYRYDDSTKDRLGEMLIEDMKDRYSEGFRVFVLTMSQAVAQVKPFFEHWRNSVSDPNQRPVLVATVTSAPDIANSKAGILRFYVRSEEEGQELAKYAYWKNRVKRVGIFRIEGSYGAGGAASFTEAFETLAGRGTTQAFVVNHSASDVGTSVTAWLKLSHGQESAVFVVGYGGMLKATLTELERQSYPGTVLCVSTITHAKWRAPGKTVITVVPSRADRGSAFMERDRDVVYFLAKVALLKTMQCCYGTSSTQDFFERWASDPSDQAAMAGLKVDYLFNGDAIIHLTVAEVQP